MSETEDVDDVDDAELDDDAEDEEEGMNAYLIALRGGAVVLAEDPAELEEVLRFWGEARMENELLMLSSGGWLAEEVVGIALNLEPEDEGPELEEVVGAFVGGHTSHPLPTGYDPTKYQPTTTSEAPPKRGRFDG